MKKKKTEQTATTTTFEELKVFFAFFSSSSSSCCCCRCSRALLPLFTRCVFCFCLRFFVHSFSFSIYYYTSPRCVFQRVVIIAWFWFMCRLLLLQPLSVYSIFIHNFSLGLFASFHSTIHTYIYSPAEIHSHTQKQASTYSLP